VRGFASPARGALTRHDVLTAGILCGVAGGVTMIGVAAISATEQGLSALHSLEVIGASLVGPEALGGAGKIAFGAVLHLLTSAAFGIVFASILPRDFPAASAIGAGVGYALFALMFMMILVVPWANPGFRWGMQAIGGSWVVGHAVFGVALGAAPRVRTWLAREERARAAPAAAPERPARLSSGTRTRTT
jgi:hypothetical protein